MLHDEMGNDNAHHALSFPISSSCSLRDDQAVHPRESGVLR